MPGRWLLPLGAGSQPRLNLPTPLTAQPPAITDGSVRRQPDNLCSRRRYILGMERILVVAETVYQLRTVV